MSEDNLMEAGGPLQSSVRLLSGGDRDENGESITKEAHPQNRAQQLQLGKKLPVIPTQVTPTSRVRLLQPGVNILHCV